MTSRAVRLSDLNERQKETTILVLHGFAKDLRALLEELSRTSPYTRRHLDRLLADHAGDLSFLERAYIRTVEDPRAVERRAEKNDRVWQKAEVHL